MSEFSTTLKVITFIAAGLAVLGMPRKDVRSGAWLVFILLCLGYFTDSPNFTIGVLALCVLPGVLLVIYHLIGSLAARR